MSNWLMDKEGANYPLSIYPNDFHPDLTSSSEVSIRGPSRSAKPGRK